MKQYIFKAINSNGWLSFIFIKRLDMYEIVQCYT